MSPQLSENPSVCSGVRIPWITACGVAMGTLLQVLLIAIAPVSAHLGGDEEDYVGKAHRLIHAGTLRPEHSTSVPPSTARSYSDFRPPGFAVMLATLGVDKINHQTYRKPIAYGYVLGLAIFVAYLVSALFAGQNRVIQFSLALAMTSFPPLFEGCLRYYPDEICALIGISALYLISRGSVSAIDCDWRFATGAVLLGLTSTIRPELIVAIPVCAFTLIVVHIASRIPRPQFDRNKVLTIARSSCLLLSFAAFIGLNVSYRWFCFHEFRIFGRLESPDPGVASWCATWLNTESECLSQIVWPMGHTNPEISIESIPRRAFASEQERDQVASLFADAAGTGYLSLETDRRFGELARQRIAANWWAHYLIPRTWRPVHLWLNLETNRQLLDWLAGIPRTVSRSLLGLALLLKISILLLSVYSTRFIIQIPWMPTWTTQDMLALQCFSFVGFRTLLIGGLLGSHEHRYALAAWPMCLVLAAYTLSRVLSTQAREQAID